MRINAFFRFFVLLWFCVGVARGQNRGYATKERISFHVGWSVVRGHVDFAGQRIPARAAFCIDHLIIFCLYCFLFVLIGM